MQTRELPYSNDAERSVIGSMLIDPEAYVKVQALVSADDFYVTLNRDLFKVVLATAQKGAADIVTVMEGVERAGLGDEIDQVRLLRYINQVPSAMNVESYAKIVVEAATRRRLIAAAGEVAKLAYDDTTDVEVACARSLAAVVNVTPAHDQRAVGAEALAGSIYDEVDEWARNPLVDGEVRGIRTQLKALDDALGGFQSGYYLVAARTGVGKTALLTQIMEGFAGDGVGSVLFILEMSAPQIGIRMASCRAQVNLHAIKQGRAEPEELKKLMDALGEINDWPIVIYDRATLRPPDVLAAVRYQQSRGVAVDAVFVDGLWLMSPTKAYQNRTQTVDSISRELKQVQRELDLPLIVAHQFNRGIEHRAEKRPVLADLRDAGEQDPDVVLMLHRAEDEPNVTEVWIKKNRWGPSNDCVKFYWKAPCMRYLPLAQGPVSERISSWEQPRPNEMWDR